MATQPFREGFLRAAGFVCRPQATSSLRTRTKQQRTSGRTTHTAINIARDPPMSDVLIKLQNWYQSQCNGKWEHGCGVTIGTLDNPGWSVNIDLKDTPWEEAVWEDLAFDRAPRDWVFCSKQGAVFKGHGDPNKLELILGHFLDQVGGR